MLKLLCGDSMKNKNLMELMINYGNLQNVKYIDNTECSSICPFCGSKGRNKFYFNSDGMYLCFLCGEKGSILSFFNKVCNLSKKDVHSLLGNYDLDSSKLEDVNVDNLLYRVSNSIKGVPYQKEKETKFPPLPTNTVKLKDVIGLNEYKPFFSYLLKRGVTQKQMLAYDIRFCINGNIKTSKGKELRITNSIIFVNYENGKPSYWNTRSIERKPFLKTFNATPLDDTYHSKKDSVFNLDKINNNTICVICESVFNALTVSDNFNDLVGVATYGKVITDKQLVKIVNKSPKKIIIGLDQDATYEMYNLVNRLQSLTYYNVYTIDYSSVKDKHLDINDLGRNKVLNLLSKSKKGNATILSNTLFNMLRG